jgi:aminopeptidase N
LDYFQETIGPYPHKQLDIILDEAGMEYPGIVTAGTINNSGPLESEILKWNVVHEIAHQWFYGIISNDPYHDAWLDEGFTAFATRLFYSEYEDLDFYFEQGDERLKELPLPVNLSLGKYSPGTQSSYMYGKAPSMLGMIFQANGGKDNAEKFLKSYFNYYQYKEIDTSEFTRFMKHFLELDDDSIFEDWLQLEPPSN